MSRKNKPAKAVKDTGAQAPVSSMPLFFKTPFALDVERHRKAAVIPKDNFSFARETNSLPLNAIEFIEASKCYPIVFTMSEQPAAVAIVGLERTNYCVDSDGSWRKNNYIPAYARQYPFVLFEQVEEKRLYLCIDEASENFSSQGGEGTAPLYGIDGKPAPIANNALQFCTAYYQHHQITRHLCKDLKDNNLLMPYQSEVQLSPERKIGLSGFQMLDEKAIGKLSDKTFLEFREKGWLPFIYMALASTSNWKKLVEMASSAERTAKVA